MDSSAQPKNETTHCKEHDKHIQCIVNCSMIDCIKRMCRVCSMSLSPSFVHTCNPSSIQIQCIGKWMRTLQCFGSVELTLLFAKPFVPGPVRWTFGCAGGENYSSNWWHGFSAKQSSPPHPVGWSGLRVLIGNCTTPTNDSGSCNNEPGHCKKDRSSLGRGDRSHRC